MSPMRVALSLLLLVRPLAGQDARLGNRLDAATRSAVELLLDSARAGGLPQEPLVQKALEGRSKNAPGERIIAAVRTLLATLRESRLALGQQAAPDELVAGANALRAGATPAAMAGMRRQRGREITIPLSVFTDLVARGIPAATAAQVVHTLVDQGLSDPEFHRLRARIEADIRTGLPPGAALERRLPGLPAAAAPRKP
jgi:hypothetical protein